MYPKKKLFRTIWIMLLIAGCFFISSCVSQNEQPDATSPGVTLTASKSTTQTPGETKPQLSQTPSSTVTIWVEEETNGSTSTSLSQAEVQVTRTLAQTPASTSTQDTRMLPEDWRDWGYLPVVSARAIEI